MFCQSGVVEVTKLGTQGMVVSDKWCQQHGSVVCVCEFMRRERTVSSGGGTATPTGRGSCIVLPEAERQSVRRNVKEVGSRK